MDEIDTKVDKATSDLKNTNVRLKDTVTQVFGLQYNVLQSFREFKTDKHMFVNFPAEIQSKLLH